MYGRRLQYSMGHHHPQLFAALADPVLYCDHLHEGGYI
jgi:hypothetical protein